MIFKNGSDYERMYDVLADLSTNEITEWKNTIGINTLSDQYEEDFKVAFSENRDYSPDEVIKHCESQAKGMLPYLFSAKGEIQFSDTILVIKGKEMIAIANEDEAIVTKIHAGEDISQLPNVTFSKHSYELTPVNVDNGMQRVLSERSSMIYYSDRIRRYVVYEGSTVKLSNNYRMTFRMTSYQQNRFGLVWWGPQTHVFIKRASIVCQGWVDSAPYYTNSGVHIFDRDAIGMHVADDFKNNLSLNVTYMFVHAVKGPEETVTRTITYSGTTF